MKLLLREVMDFQSTSCRLPENHR